MILCGDKFLMAFGVPLRGRQLTVQDIEARLSPNLLTTSGQCRKWVMGGG